MSYQRVIPRDLFNESKLLKCLGQLSLLVHNETVNLIVDYDESIFLIKQRPEDGGLYCTTINFFIGKQKLELFTSYNSKSPYPLLCMADELLDVFNDDGTPTIEFLQYLQDTN